MGGWGWGGYGYVGGVPCMYACTHMYTCTCMLNMVNMDASMLAAICNFYTRIHVHACACMCMHVGYQPMPQMPPTHLPPPFAICNFYTCIHVHACMCMHAHVCACMWDTTPCPRCPPPTCPLPRVTGSPKHQNSISPELIKII